MNGVPLNFDELRRVYRLEKNSSKLVVLQEDFFNQLFEFMELERKTYLDSLKDLNQSKARDFNNLKKIIEELFLLREKKILNKALIDSRLGESDGEVLTLHEKKLFEELVKAMKGHSQLLNQILEFDKAALISHDKKMVDSSATTERSSDLALVELKFSEKISPFIGPDMKEYGPFEPGQTANVPFKVANILVGRNIASKV